ncbi:MAG: hypothetical protein ACRCT1_03450 [Microcoleaceae cyanobacterium]
MTNFPGEVAPLESALGWALGAVIWAQLGQRFPLYSLISLKGTIALLM